MGELSKGYGYEHTHFKLKDHINQHRFDLGEKKIKITLGNNNYFKYFIIFFIYFFFFKFDFLMFLHIKWVLFIPKSISFLVPFLNL